MNIDKFRSLLALMGGLLGLALLAPRAAAQQQSAVAGRVVDQATQQPVPGALVLLVGTNRSVQTAQDGRYRLEGVPPGRATIQVRAIGFASASQAVTVTAGAAAELDFSLTAGAVV